MPVHKTFPELQPSPGKAFTSIQVHKTLFLITFKLVGRQQIYRLKNSLREHKLLKL